MKLKHLQRCPYGGMYEIKMPEIGFVGRGTNFENLEADVRRYRKANGIPTGIGFSQELEEKVAGLYPSEAEIADPEMPQKARLTFEDVIHGTKVLLSFKLAGSPLVPREEALRRGEICSRCPLCVVHARPCGGLCGELKTIVDALIGGYSTPFDTDLRACSICHCNYASHIRIPFEHLKKGITPQMEKQFEKAASAYSCWKRIGAI